MRKLAGFFGITENKQFSFGEGIPGAFYIAKVQRIAACSHACRVLSRRTTMTE